LFERRPCAVDFIREGVTVQPIDQAGISVAKQICDSMGSEASGE
jgi:hypothetical protein